MRTPRHISRDLARTQELASGLASFVLLFENILVYFCSQCLEEQILAFLGQVRAPLGWRYIGKRTALRRRGSGRVRILWRSWRWCDSGSGNTTKRYFAAGREANRASRPLLKRALAPNVNKRLMLNNVILHWI